MVWVSPVMGVVRLLRRGNVMSDTPIFEQMSALYADAKRTAHLEVRMELVKALKALPKTTKQILEVIKGLQDGTY